METEKKVRSEQIKQLYRHTPIGTIATLVNSVVLCLMLWNVIPHSRLIIWFSAIVSVSLLRCSLFLKYGHSSPILNDAFHWEVWSLASLIFSGVVWGSAGIFLFPVESPAHQTFVAFVLGGMVAGASGTFSVMIRYFLAFSLPALVPIIVRFVMVGNTIHLGMGGMTLLFWILMFFNAKRINTAISSSIRLQFENVNLVDYLATEKDRIEKLNKDYLSEIEERKQIEKKLEHARGELEYRVAGRTNELMKANEQLRREIVERKRTDEALRESEEKYRRLVDNATDAIFIAQDEVLKFPNPKTEEITGYSSEELANIHFADFIHPEDNDTVLNTYMKMIGDKKPTGMCSFRLINRTGKELSVQLNSVFINWEGRPASLNFLRDITEQKELEDQLQRALKMEAIGTLAGGVAHDLNNILSGIVSYPDLLLMQIPENSPLRKPVLVMQDAGLRATSVVQDLLTLARRGVTVKELVNENEIITAYLQSPEYEKLKSDHHGVEVETDFESGLLNISGSSVHMSKTVMNLMSNAAESIQDEGKIIISTKNEYIDRPISGYDSVEEGDYVTLTVSDTGTGISSQDMERIFEPFYTKKVMGRSGTGLGMSVVWGTVKDHNGYIDIRSTEDKGTTIKLYFPATREKSRIEKTQLSFKDYKGNGESILVIDDVKTQREIARNILNTLGYEAATVSSGEEAVEYLKEQIVDLVLLDMIMDPGIDGLDTYRKILQLHPGQKAIISSGYSETDRVKDAQRLGAGQYVKKPYTLEKIGVAVKSELRR